MNRMQRSPTASAFTPISPAVAATESGDLAEVVTLFKALADATRLRVVGLLAEREMCGRDVAEALGISGPTVTHHLALLKDAGLVREARRAPYVYYRLDLGALQKALRSVAGREKVQTFARGDAVPAEERRVLNAFFDGARLTALPAQHHKKEIVLREVLRRLPVEDAMRERDLDTQLKEIHEDYCAIRRAFVEHGWMRRAAGIYRITERGREVRAAR